jgi:hypothetical protein
MFTNNLKRPALALAATAAVLAVAGPASAAPASDQKVAPPTDAIIVYDYEGAPVHQVPKGESILVDLPPLAIITDLPPVTAKVPQARPAPRHA